MLFWLLILLSAELFLNLRNFVGYKKTNVHYIGKFHYHFSLKFGPFQPGIQTSLLKLT